jgi:hypothetical protein
MSEDAARRIVSTLVERGDLPDDPDCRRYAEQAAVSAVRAQIRSRMRRLVARMLPAV